MSNPEIVKATPATCVGCAICATCGACGALPGAYPALAVLVDSVAATAIVTE